MSGRKIYKEISKNTYLRVNMANIRRKIEKDPGHPEYLFTEVGVGYRMREGDWVSLKENSWRESKKGAAYAASFFVPRTGRIVALFIMNG